MTIAAGDVNGCFGFNKSSCGANVRENERIVGPADQSMQNCNSKMVVRFCKDTGHVVQSSFSSTGPTYLGDRHTSKIDALLVPQGARDIFSEIKPLYRAMRRLTTAKTKELRDHVPQFVSFLVDLRERYSNITAPKVDRDAMMACLETGKTASSFWTT